MIFSYLLNMQSHPSWVCGLKLQKEWGWLSMPSSHPSWVCGLKPLWWWSRFYSRTSHPSWVCGLKLPLHNFLFLRFRHTLRGCVDWNLLTIIHVIGVVKSHPSWVCGLKHFVTDFFSTFHCHTLRGCVDWNPSNEWSAIALRVTPFVGVWIETP